jgi:tight adherence protein C
MHDTSLLIASFLGASSLVLLAFVVLDRRKSGVDGRLGNLARERREGQGAPLGDGKRMSPHAENEGRADWFERRTARRLKQEQRAAGLNERMAHAGFYQPRAAQLFVLARFVLLLVPVVAGWGMGNVGVVRPGVGIVLGALAGVVGTLTPSFWLDHLKRARQMKIRRALPDAFDVMTVCLRGGLSLAGTFSRVARELAVVHPMLAVEFHILERQVQMGRTTGEAVRELARRFDLEELRSMSSVIIHTERLGSSIVSAFEVFSDTLRQKRQQRAEEMGQKANVTLLLPTMLCIFPGVFVVILGPAALQVYKMFSHGIMH